MTAKCAKCQEVFPTERYGRQNCPKCGAGLMLAAPPGTPEVPSDQPPSSAPGPGPQLPPPGGFGAPFPPSAPHAEDGPQDQPTPWEERSRLGIVSAYVETVQRS